MMSRLNEALLVAFSAMSPTNLKAVDQVVKIVRELDRYGGAFVAGWRRPEAPELDAPAEADAAFARAWPCGGEPALPDVDRHREPRSGVAIRNNVERPCAPRSPPFARDEVAADRVLGSCDRPDNQVQSLENVNFAPGHPSAGETGAGARPASNDRPIPETAPPDLSLIPESRAGVLKGASFNAHVAAPAGDDRPENPAQAFERVESAPGVGTAPSAARTPVRSPRTTAVARPKPLLAASRATFARKIRHKALIPLNPRPGRAG